MVRFGDLLHRRKVGKGSKNEQFLYPYNPASQAYSPAPQTTTQTTFATDAGHIVADGLPQARQGLDVDSKLDLRATYSPTEVDPLIAPPGYVSREPSAAAPPSRPPPLRPDAVIRPEIPMRPSPSVPSASPPARAAPRIPERQHTTMTFTAPLSAAPAVTSAYLPPQTPGDRPMDRCAGQRVTAEELHELAGWIRRRYQLDITIYEEGNQREEDRDITRKKMNEAEALMSKIRGTVELWNHPSYFEEGTGDYEAFCEVVRRINLPGKRDWIKEPPWTNTGIGPLPRRQLR